MINLRSVVLGQIEKGKEASTRTVAGESNDREEKENADTGRVRNHKLSYVILGRMTSRQYRLMLGAS